MTKEVILGEQGDVIIPPEIMEALGVKPGDKILFVPTDIGYEITTRKALVRRVRGSLARDDGRDMTQELLDERRAEAAKKWL